MRNLIGAVPVALAGGLIGALAMAQSRPVIHTSADPKRPPEARSLGKPQDCIPLGYVKDTLVYSDGLIDFVMATHRTFRVELSPACEGLGAAGRFGYAKGLTQLCASDTITVAPQGGGAGATCTLAKFHPVELVQRRF